jgi:ketosteroid isomerase-like protein
MERQAFQNWLDRYIEAWKTYDEQKINDLFSDDVVYRYHPADDALKVSGRDEVVKSWLDGQDDPETYDAKYEVLAIDGDTHVANGWSRYFTGPGGELRDEYFNVYICKFDADGRCKEFTEYWIQNRDFRRRDREDLIRQTREESQVTAAAAA